MTKFTSIVLVLQGAVTLAISLLLSLMFILLYAGMRDLEQELKDTYQPALTAPLTDDLPTPTHEPDSAETWPWGAGTPSWDDVQAQPDLAKAWVEERCPNHYVIVTESVVTAYTPGVESCGEFADGKTATMGDASLPGYAVPGVTLREMRKLDALVWVPGYPRAGPMVPDDTGGALNRTLEDTGMLHIDIRVEDVEWCYNEWGKRVGLVFLIYPRGDA